MNKLIPVNKESILLAESYISEIQYIEDLLSEGKCEIERIIAMLASIRLNMAFVSGVKLTAIFKDDDEDVIFFDELEGDRH